MQLKGFYARKLISIIKQSPQILETLQLCADQNCQTIIWQVV